MKYSTNDRDARFAHELHFAEDLDGQDHAEDLDGQGHEEAIRLDDRDRDDTVHRHDRDRDDELNHDLGVADPFDDADDPGGRHHDGRGRSAR